MISHDQHVANQFGAVAANYLTSTVHARGRDLERLKESAMNMPGQRVLDLGCGAGHVVFAVAPHAAEVVAYDLSDAMLKVVEQEAARRGLSNIAIRQGGVERLPFESASFDRIYTRFSAHHWRDLPAALHEARRVLKTGGRLIVIDVLGAEDPLHDTFLQTIELLRDVSHVRNRSRSQWRAELDRAGFDCVDQDNWRLRLDFESWVARMNTPPERVAAIRSLLAEASADTRSDLQLEPDGTFHPEVGWFECVARPE